MPPTIARELTNPLVRDVARARHLFFEQNTDPAGLVPDLIARSWKRCVGQVHEGVDLPEPVSAASLSRRRESCSRLLRHALPEVEALAEALSSSRTVLVLSDASGVILDARGCRDFLHKAQQMALQPGVQWSESRCGTNAIGTALVEDQPVMVLGGEHFIEANRMLGCTALPLHAPDGVVLGVLDVSGEPEAIGPSLAALLRMAAGLIEHRIALDPEARVSVLRFASKSALLGTHREGLLWVHDGQVTGANRVALNLLESRLDDVRGRSVDEMFSRLPSLRQTDSAVAMHDRAGIRSFVARWLGRDSANSTPGPSHRQPMQLAGESARKDPHTVDAGGELRFDQATATKLVRATRVLDAGIPVLVQGETGVGKEVFTRQLHMRSARRDGPIVAVNCAALPEGLIEAELFGYEEGAFTGARRRGQPGRIREAHGGVLLLDEIGDMPLMLQARLLRVLQDRQVQPLGGGRTHAVDFSLVCATHRDLKSLVAQGKFREDLLFRLQHHVVELQPLRQRADLVELVVGFVNDMLQCAGLGITEAAFQALCRYDWPGNLRQLCATLKTMAALAEPESVIDVDDLPSEIAAHGIETMSSPMAQGVQQQVQPLRSQASAAIEAALVASAGNVSAAARRLGVHRSTVHRHLNSRRSGL